MTPLCRIHVSDGRRPVPYLQDDIKRRRSRVCGINSLLIEKELPTYGYVMFCVTGARLVHNRYAVVAEAGIETLVRGVVAMTRQKYALLLIQIICN